MLHIDTKKKRKVKIKRLKVMVSRVFTVQSRFYDVGYMVDILHRMRCVAPAYKVRSLLSAGQ
jgi:hypothetical protein